MAMTMPHLSGESPCMSFTNTIWDTCAMTAAEMAHDRSNGWKRVRDRKKEIRWTRCTTR